MKVNGHFLHILENDLSIYKPFSMNSLIIKNINNILINQKTNYFKI